MQTTDDLDEKNILIALGMSIRKARIARGMTQKQLAYSCLFEKATMSKIEAGKVNITFHTFFRICRCLGIAMRDLVSIT
jgi:DNA-binding XRE family transcriptional regulator